MKRTLLIAALLAAGLSHAQVITSENFDSMFAGELGTDITGTTPTNGIFTISSNGTAPTTATNAANDNYLVMDGDATHLNVLQMTGTNGDKGSRNLWFEAFPDGWADRTAGNDIVEVEYDFYTGTPGASKNRFGIFIYDATRTKILGGYQFDSSTLVISGVAYYTAATAPVGNYLFYLGTGATNVTLTANTWVRVGVSFNKTTGQVIWKGPGWNGQVIGAATATDPDRTSFISTSGTTTTAPIVTNAAAASIQLDNINVRASATDTLLGVEAVSFADASLSVFPNPATTTLNISQRDASFTSASILDLNGRTVSTTALQGRPSASVDVSGLAPGAYLLKIETAQGQSVRKFIKQ